MDEARHVEVYERYVRKLAIVYPISPWLKELIDATLQADHYVKILIGMNMVVEGLALAAFHNMRRQATCPLLRELTHYVLQDESRHVAFGNVYVQETIARDAPGRARGRRAVRVRRGEERWSTRRAASTARASAGRPRLPARCSRTLGIDPQDFIKGMIEAGAAGINAKLPPGHIHSFKDLMMPALVRVGAVTERTRELYAAEASRVWEDARVLESMEDAETGDLDGPASA